MPSILDPVRAGSPLGGEKAHSRVRGERPGHPDPLRRVARGRIRGLFWGQDISSPRHGGFGAQLRDLPAAFWGQKSLVTPGRGECAAPGWLWGLRRGGHGSLGGG